MALPISYGASKAARLASAQEFLPSGFGASTAAVSGRSSYVLFRSEMGLESIGGVYGITYILWSIKGR